MLTTNEVKKMKKYSLKWWYRTGKSFKKQDMQEGYRRTKLGMKKAKGKLNNVAFRIGYWAA
jgi:hypothetical protein